MLLLPDAKQLYMTIVFYDVSAKYIIDSTSVKNEYLQQVEDFDSSRTAFDFEKPAVYSRNTE